MAWVYHGVPRHMVGEVIYPLNRLRQIDERLYDVQVGSGVRIVAWDEPPENL